MRNKIKLINFFRIISILGFLIFFLFGLISFFVSISSEYDLYFDFSNYTKKEVSIKEIICTNCGKGSSFSLTGYIDEKRDTIIGRMFAWKRCEKKGNYNILESYEKKKKKMIIWINPNSNRAYFYEINNPTLTFWVIWNWDLVRLMFFLIFILTGKYLFQKQKQMLKKINLSFEEYLKLKKDNKLDVYYLQQFKDKE